MGKALDGQAIRTRYDVDSIKGYVKRVKTQLGYYAEEPPKTKADPNLEVIRRFENYAGGRIIGVNTHGGSLHINVYKGSNGTSHTTSVVIEQYFKSTTVQILGSSIAQLVIDRANMDEFQKLVTPEALKQARRVKADLEARI